MNIRDLIDKRNKLVAQSRQIIDAGDPVNGFTPEQRNAMDRIDLDLERAQRDVDLATIAEQTYTDARSRVSPGAPRNHPGAGGQNRVGSQPRINHDAQHGEIRFIAPNESVAVGRREQRALPNGMVREDLSAGRLIRSLITGDWRGAEAEEQLHRETRGQGGAVSTLGGFLMPDALSDNVLDLARAAAVCISAGAQTIPMDTATLRIAKVDGDPSGGWRAENQTISSSTMVFGAINLEARSLACLIPISRELLADAQNAPAVIDRALMAQFALALDTAGLRGSGASLEPLGIRNWVGVTLSTATSSTTYASIVSAIGSVWGANGEPNAFITSARTAQSIAAWTDSQGQPLRAPSVVEDLKRYRTTSIPISGSAGVGTSTAQGSTSATELYVGDFGQLAFGIRSGIEIELNAQASDAAGQGFTKNQAFVRAILRADVAVLQPTWFTVILGSTM